MKIVYAYNTNSYPNEKTELVGKIANSYRAFFPMLIEGDHATVEVSGKGFKNINVKNGQLYVQRNFAYDY